MLGPIPKGVPVGLLANLKLRAESDDLGEKAAHVQRRGRAADQAQARPGKRAPPGASDDELRQHFANLREPMLELSKCPDFVVNRGHYFGTAEFNRQDGLERRREGLRHASPSSSDDDKRALIAFLKTF